MVKKSKVKALVKSLRSLVERSDKEVLSDLGLILSDEPNAELVDESLLSDLHQFESAAFKLLVAIDLVNYSRRFG